MKKTLAISTLTLVFLVVLDAMVAVTLNWAERKNRLGSLVQYFEYGRSVPGKLEKWQAEPEMPGNLFDVAWRDDLVRYSAAQFADEPADQGQVLRSYGMSFVDNILKNAEELRPDLIWDGHSGPAAPPNYTYALFEDDRDNRRTGDIVILGILSSGVPSMSAMSNSTWLFEQPAPLTYPIYQPAGGALQRIDPLVDSSADQRALTSDNDARAAWQAQLARHDAFYSPTTFGLSWLDSSPFARLVRRALAKSHIEGRTSAVLDEALYPYKDALPLMIRDFATTARADGQIPVVLLLQTRDQNSVDILALSKPILEANDILYLASAEYFSIRNPANFISDGHYRPELDRLLAKRLLTLLGLYSTVP